MGDLGYFASWELELNKEVVCKQVHGIRIKSTKYAVACGVNVNHPIGVAT